MPTRPRPFPHLSPAWRRRLIVAALVCSGLIGWGTRAADADKKAAGATEAVANKTEKKGPEGQAAVAPVAVARIDGPIGPATADYVVRAIAKAQEQGAQLFILEMDTPGGLDTSMRAIIRVILGAPFPIVSYVAPEGARAASAGTYIMYASHVAAMAPATNLGAATPVAIGPGGPADPPGEPEQPVVRKDEKKNKEKGKDDAAPAARSPGSAESLRAKQINDAAAYIRGLAELRGRNAEWAERAVREAVSLSASEAAKEKVIDLVAADRTALLKALDGRRIKLRTGEIVLQTAGAQTIDLPPDARTRFLSAITHPSVALILMLLGVYGLFFEFSSPGFGIAGVAGGICLLLGLYALQLLPVNYAGLGLLLLGLALMIAEVFAPSFGVLGFGGIVAFILGATLLFDTEVPGFEVSMALIYGLAIASALLIVVVGGMAWRARRMHVVSGREQLIGAPGEVVDAEGWALVHGERWRVRSATPLVEGQRVRVVGVDGLTLDVVEATEPRTTGVTHAA